MHEEPYYTVGDGYIGPSNPSYINNGMGYDLSDAEEVDLVYKEYPMFHWVGMIDEDDGKTMCCDKDRCSLFGIPCRWRAFEAHFYLKYGLYYTINNAISEKWWWIQAKAARLWRFIRRQPEPTCGCGHQH
jgi:hypothetical protein